MDQILQHLYEADRIEHSMFTSKSEIVRQRTKCAIEFKNLKMYSHAAEQYFKVLIVETDAFRRHLIVCEIYKCYILSKQLEKACEIFRGFMFEYSLEHTSRDAFYGSVKYLVDLCVSNNCVEFVEDILQKIIKLNNSNDTHIVHFKRVYCRYLSKDKEKYIEAGDILMSSIDTTLPINNLIYGYGVFIVREALMCYIMGGMNLEDAKSKLPVNFDNQHPNYSCIMTHLAEFAEKVKLSKTQKSTEPIDHMFDLNYLTERISL